MSGLWSALISHEQRRALDELGNSTAPSEWRERYIQDRERRVRRILGLWTLTWAAFSFVIGAGCVALLWGLSWLLGWRP